MKVGDYVGKINNSWIEKNKHLAGSTIAEELFKYGGPEPLGVIVQFSFFKKHVIVLMDDGTLDNFLVEAVEVMSGCN